MKNISCISLFNTHHLPHEKGGDVAQRYSPRLPCQRPGFDSVKPSDQTLDGTGSAVGGNNKLYHHTNSIEIGKKCKPKAVTRRCAY